jgi:hypothetical protein
MSEKRAEEATRMSRPEVRETEAEPESAPDQDPVESTEDREAVTPPIDEDVAGSVNAALHEADEVSERRTQMGETQEYRRLSREELDKLAGEELPERAAMSLINANIAAPINAAVALNVASDDSIAYANAEQTGDITQTN